MRYQTIDESTARRVDGVGAPEEEAKHFQHCTSAETSFYNSTSHLGQSAVKGWHYFRTGRHGRVETGFSHNMNSDRPGVMVCVKNSDKKRQISESISSLDNRKELKGIVQDFTSVNCRNALQASSLEMLPVILDSFVRSSSCRL